MPKPLLDSLANLFKEYENSTYSTKLDVVKLQAFFEGTSTYAEAFSVFYDDLQRDDNELKDDSLVQAIIEFCKKNAGELDAQDEILRAQQAAEAEVDAEAETETSKDPKERASKKHRNCGLIRG